MLPQYKSSGNWGVATVPAVLMAMAVSAALAWVYQVLVDLIPLLVVKGFIAMGFMLALGVVARWGMRVGKCRNAGIAWVSGLLVGGTALAASHVFAYINLHASAGIPLSAAMPVADYIQLRTDTGWTFGRGGSGIPIRGALVWAVWVVEAGLLLLGGVFGVSMVASPFCENCLKWADHKKTEFMVHGPSEEAIAQVKGATDVVAVLDVKDGENEPAELKYALLTCPKCGGLPTLAVTLKRTSRKGKKKSTSTTVLKTGILLAEEEAETVLAMSGKV
jgi:hypothetical protein